MKGNPKRPAWMIAALIAGILVIAAGVFFGIRLLQKTARTQDDTVREGSSAGSTEAGADPRAEEETAPAAAPEIVPAERKLVLLADTAELPAREAAEVDLTVRIFSGTEPADLEIVHGSGAVLKTVDRQDLAADAAGNMEVNIRVTVPAAQDGITAECLTARMGGEVSADLILYRAVTVTPEMTDRLCGIMDEVSAEAEEDLLRLTREPDARELQTVRKRLLALLSARNDVSAAWEAGASSVRFSTADGLAGGFLLETVSDDPETYMLGAHPAREPLAKDLADRTGAPSGQFVYDPSFYDVATDPDVLVLTPLSDSDAVMHSLCVRMETLGYETAKKLGGSCTVYNKGVKDAQAMNRFAQDPLTDYGTVLILTHGLTEERPGGTKLFSMILYRDPDLKSAREAFDAFGDLQGLPESALADAIVLKNNRKEILPASFVLYWTYSFKVGEARFHNSFDIAVTSNWFQRRYPDLRMPNTVIDCAICHSGADPQFSSFFMDHGASCMIAYPSEAVAVAAVRQAEGLIGDMLKPDPALTDGEAGSNYTLLKLSQRMIDYCYPQIFTQIVSYQNLDFTYSGFGRLQGSVSDAQGQPCGDVQIRAWRYWNGRLQQEQRAVTDGSGTFVLSSLPWGMYLLQASDGTGEGCTSFSFADQLQTVSVILNGDQTAVPQTGASPEMTDEQREETAAIPERTEAQTAESGETPGTIHDIDVYDIIALSTQGRAQIAAQFDAPSQDDPDMLRFENVSYLGENGHLRFFYEGDTLTCVSWTAYQSSKELSDRILADLRTYGPDGTVRTPKDGQTEQSVVVDGVPVYAGYENSSGGEYSYVFWASWG